MKEWLILGVKQGQCKMTLEHFIMTEKRKKKEILQESWGMSTGYINQFERAPSGKIGKFEHQINNNKKKL